MGTSAVALVLLLLTISALNADGSLATPPPAGDWKVQDQFGHTCMRLSFAAEYVVNGQGFTNHVVNIVPSSYPQGDCASPTRLVKFFPDSTSRLWYLQLGFKLNTAATTYAMTEVTGSWPDCPSCQDAVSASIFSVNFLQNNVTIGKAYVCADELTVNWGDAELYMWNMHLQPFAEDSGGKFGPEQRCGTVPKPTEGAPIVVIVCSAVGGVLFLALVATVALIVVIRYRKRHAYTSIQS